MCHIFFREGGGRSRSRGLSSRTVDRLSLLTLYARNCFLITRHCHDTHAHAHISLSHTCPVDLAHRPPQRQSKNLSSGCQQCLKDNHALRQRRQLVTARARERAWLGRESLSFLVLMLPSSILAVPVLRIQWSFCSILCSSIKDPLGSCVRTSGLLIGISSSSLCFENPLLRWKALSKIGFRAGIDARIIPMRCSALQKYLISNPHLPFQSQSTTSGTPSGTHINHTAGFLNVPCNC